MSVSTNRLLLTAGTLAVVCWSCGRNMVVDADGNTYRTVRIGKQVWTVENLRTTRFNDGTPIPHVPDAAEWRELQSAAYCSFANTKDADSIKQLGLLYNWYAVRSGKLAPQGWRVPTNADWDTLQCFLITHGYNWDRTRNGNKIAKSLAAQHGWFPFGINGTPGNNPKANNRSGFAGLPAGSRFDTRDTIPGTPWQPLFVSIGQKGTWWSATEVNNSMASVYGLSCCVEGMLKYNSFYKTCGYSVRLLKDRQ